jgi:hypothetical protein
MSELVFLLEEESAKAMLETLLPRILDERIVVRAIAFEGKQDLERQLERKLKNYANRDARFIVLRDQDSGDCALVKANLIEICRRSGRIASTQVRIACRELESFYLADLGAVEIALGVGNLAKHQNGAKYRNPDRLGSPSLELKKLTAGQYQKVGGSRRIGCHLDPANLRSSSFRYLISAIRRWEHELLSTIDRV